MKRYDFTAILAAAALLNAGFLIGCGGGSSGGGGTTGTPTPTATPTPSTRFEVQIQDAGGAVNGTGRLNGVTVNTPARFIGKNITFRIEGHPDYQTDLRSDNAPGIGQIATTVPAPSDTSLYNRPLPFKIFDPDGIEIPFRSGSVTTFFWSAPSP